jgi:hypothetical protein
MRLSALLLAAAVFLSACGSSTGDRAASGAGIGAAAGAVVGAVTGLSLLQGVVIGAAAGGVIGGVTDESTINLGDPIWAKGDQPANSAAVSRVQAGLTRLGYDPGPADGVMGTRTRTAIEAYQRDHGLLVDGRPTVQLAQHIDDRLKLADNN